MPDSEFGKIAGITFRRKGEEMAGARYSRLMVAAVGVLLVIGLTLIPGCGSKAAKPVQKAAGVLKATVTGANFCLGCALKKEHEAKARCSVYGHKHSLKVTKAVGEDGSELAGLQGTVLHYLETERSHAFIRGHHEEVVTVTGKVYPLERILEVESPAR